MPRDIDELMDALPAALIQGEMTLWETRHARERTNSKLTRILGIRHNSNSLCAKRYTPTGL